jgi:replication factor C subunit 2/4
VIFNTTNTMAVTKGEETGESSMSAAEKVLKANTNGPANYELPW